MEESESHFPFPKLRFCAYVTLNVMMHVEYEKAFKFIFSINKEGRSFFLKKFITIRNGFINYGLIPYELECKFNGLM